MPIGLDDISISSFLDIFKKIIKQKTDAGIRAIQDNPDNLVERARFYGTQFANGSWGWTSNIWNRSAAGSVVVDREEDLKPEHKELMLRVLEYILSQQMLKVDATLGQPNSRAQMHGRLYCAPQFPDIAYRWAQLNFPGDPQAEPDAQIFCIPHYLENPNVPGSSEMLRVLRFPQQGYSIITSSSYQGECKKGFLSHWIYHVYKKGGTGEHASLKEFTVRQVNAKEKRIIMGVWGLTGSGKSTHGMYIVNDITGPIFKKKFGLDPREFVYDQVIKNDDIVGVFADVVVSPERGSWTKTEDVDETQVGIYKAAMSSRALHENTEWDKNGHVCFDGKLFQYHGRLNQNARTVLYLEDTGYFDGNVDSSGPLNMAVFISPGYNSDYAWLKINDPAFGAKVLSDGRTVGHPAQSRKGVGEEKYETRYCQPFTMGVGNAAHIKRFYEFVKKRQDTDNPIDVYLINTTGRVGTEYDWVEEQIDGKKLSQPQAVPTAMPGTRFKEVNGKIRPVGGTGPSIEETELFLFQAARGAVEYQPHPIWGQKVLVPAKVPGIRPERLKELDPFNYHPKDEMAKLLRAQILTSKLYLDKQCPGLPDCIYHAMDF